jgi:branched-chain amino acid transport system permease protein
VRYDMGFVPGIKAFAAAVLGGIGSVTGAMLGGLIIGITEIFTAAYISSDYKDVFAFVILIAVLYFMPTGLLGENINDTRV